MRVREWTSGDQSSGGASEAARLKPRLGPAAEAADTPRVYGQRRAASLLAHYIPAPMPKPCSRLAWSAAACTYLLIILGAIVRITGSGMGCGDHWPLCNGKLLPPLDLPTLIEYGHRLAAALVSVLVSALAAYAWWLRRGAGSGERYVPSRTAYVALGLLSVQVVLGARATRRAHRQPGRGVGVPRLPAVQRADRARWELPAVHPVDPPAARVHAVRLFGVVGLAHAGARGVGGGGSRHTAGGGRRR